MKVFTWVSKYQVYASQGRSIVTSSTRYGYVYASRLSTSLNWSRSIRTISTMTSIPTLKMNDGHSIPLLAYGTGTKWFKGSKSGEPSIDRTLVDSVKQAIELGYRHLDGAEVYGTEPELGLAIRESNVPREDLFITTKVMHGIKDIPRAFEKSLEKLGLDYVDLYLIHSPFFATSDQDLREAWSSMESVKASGRAKSIGVSNFLPSHLSPILAKAKVTPAINQIEYHPYLQHEELLKFQHHHGIAISAYGPLTAITKASGGPVDEIYTRLAKKNEVTTTEVALRWCIDQNIVAITTTSKKERMKGFLKTLGFQLDEKEVQEITDKGREKNFRGFWNDKFGEGDWS